MKNYSTKQFAFIPLKRGEVIPVNHYVKTGDSESTNPEWVGKTFDDSFPADVQILVKHEIRTFQHTRKGAITGFITKDDGEWVTIRVAEEFEPEFKGGGGGYNDVYEEGEEITVRKSLIANLRSTIN